MRTTKRGHPIQQKRIGKGVTQSFRKETTERATNFP